MAVDAGRATKEAETLRKQCRALCQELKEALQEADVAKCRRDWAFQERDKIVAERDSIRYGAGRVGSDPVHAGSVGRLQSFAEGPGEESGWLFPSSPWAMPHLPRSVRIPHVCACASIALQWALRPCGVARGQAGFSGAAADTQSELRSPRK